MNYKNFSFGNDNYLILCKEETYTRTASGKSWKGKPEATERSVISPENYTNYITSIPFFNNWGNGAYCRAGHNYTCAGYLPVSMVTVSPYKEKKIVHSFRFLSKRELLKNAGWRENEIVKNANAFYVEYTGDGREMIHLFTNDIGVTGAGIFETNAGIWRN